MEPWTEEQDQAASFRACNLLKEKGFRFIGGWLFVKNGVTYDLSAADLGQIERIEREGLCVVES